ncbi:unnamed protein product, partial [Scytosiphon promiscuus]
MSCLWCPQFRQVHATYEGTYTGGKKAGTGKMIYPNGDEYTGEWKDNAMEGEGTYVNKPPLRVLTATNELLQAREDSTRSKSNGSISSPSSFERGSTLRHATQDIYSGSWVANKKNGQGMYQFGADDSTMHGTWVDGTIAEGTWVFKDGTVYTGRFEGGRPKGEGKFAFPSGISQSGVYEAAAREEDADE